MENEVIELVQGDLGMELPVEEGNWVMLREKGYSPVQSLVASVGACGAYVYQSVLENSEIPYTFHKVSVTYERNLQKKPYAVSAITMTFYVTIDQSHQQRAARAIKLVSRNCPVIESLNPAIIVEELVEFI